MHGPSGICCNERCPPPHPFSCSDFRMARDSMATQATYGSERCWFLWFHTSHKLGPRISMICRQGSPRVRPFQGQSKQGLYTYESKSATAKLRAAGRPPTMATHHDIEVVLLALVVQAWDAVRLAQQPA